VTPDVAILGGGAAGLMAAIRAAERGRRVLLLERNRKPGAKILMSGGTRCNITHDASADELARAFAPRQARFLAPSLRALGPREVVAWFEAQSVRTKVEPPHGKVFPRSDRATDVLDALVRAARERGVELRREARVVAARRSGDGFALALEGQGELVVPRVVVATGGKSYAKAGFTGDGYDLARALGHTIVTPRPALVPITLSRPFACSGVALEDARVGLAAKGGKVIAARRGELLFTHRGVSGPAALDVSGELTARTSGAVRDVPEGTRYELALDLAPATPHENLQELLSTKERGRGARAAATALHDLGLPRALVKELLARASVPEPRTVQELRREERTALVRAVKDARLEVEGTLGFDKAEVTAGGVALDEVDPRTLASKKTPGLWLIGEVLDLDGPIGGYNFQAAWSTGWAAGEAV
jgi:predicted Rossmann fold flavoprotein